MSLEAYARIGEGFLNSRRVMAPGMFEYSDQRFEVRDAGLSPYLQQRILAEAAIL